MIDYVAIAIHFNFMKHLIGFHEYLYPAPAS